MLPCLFHHVRTVRCQQSTNQEAGDLQTMNLLAPLAQTFQPPELCEINVCFLTTQFVVFCYNIPNVQRRLICQFSYSKTKLSQLRITDLKDTLDKIGSEYRHFLEVAAFQRSGKHLYRTYLRNTFSVAFTSLSRITGSPV